MTWLQNNNIQREFTFFIYLNNVDQDSGGETTFPKLGLSFKPRQGDALFWKNCETKNACNDMTLHQGNPPTKGLKYELNIWVRFDPYQ